MYVVLKMQKKKERELLSPTILSYDSSKIFPLFTAYKDNSLFMGI